MTKLTKSEILDQLRVLVSNIDPEDLDTDNDGQLIIYTDIYKHPDGSFSNEKSNGS